VWILCWIALFVLCGCGPGIADTQEDLGGGYTYIAEGSTRRIFPKSSYEDGIYPNVANYSFDSNFIIVKQIPVYEDINNYLPQKPRICQRNESADL